MKKDLVKLQTWDESAKDGGFSDEESLMLENSNLLLDHFLRLEKSLNLFYGDRKDGLHAFSIILANALTKYCLGSFTNPAYVNYGILATIDTIFKKAHEEHRKNVKNN